MPFYDKKGILNMNSAPVVAVGSLMKTQVLCKVFKRFLPADDERFFKWVLTHVSDLSEYMNRWLQPPEALPGDLAAEAMPHPPEAKATG